MKLKQSGFEDIEDQNSSSDYLKQWHSHYFQTRYTPDCFEAKREYFYMAEEFLNNHEFESSFDHLVWGWHAQGFALRDIASRLRDCGYQADKDVVNRVVRRLSAEMKLGLK